MGLVNYRKGENFNRDTINRIRGVRSIPAAKPVTLSPTIYAVVMTAVQRPAEPFDTSLIPGRIAIIGKEYESADDYEKCICTELAENLYTGETTIAEQIPVGRTVEVVQANSDYYAAVNLYEFVECYVPDTICGGNHGTGLQESPDGTVVPGSYNVTFFTSLLPIDYKIAPGGVLLQRVSNRLEVVGTACGNIVEPLPPDAEPGVYRLGVPVLIQCNNSGLCVFEHSIEQGVPVKDDDGNILYYKYFDTGYRVQVDASNLGGQPTVGVTWTDPEGVEHTETQTYACVCPEPTPTPSPSPTPTPSPTPPPDAMCGNIPYNSTTHKCCTVIIGGDQAYAVVVPIGQDCPDNSTPTPTPSPTPTPTPTPLPSPTPMPTLEPDSTCGTKQYNSTTNKCCSLIIAGFTTAVVIPIDQDCSEVQDYYDENGKLPSGSW